MLHVRVDALERLLRRPRRAGHDRPIDQRIERELIAADIETDRIAGFERGALGEKERQSGEAGLAHGVHIVVAGHDESELGFQRRARHVIALRILRVGVRQRGGGESRSDQQDRGAAARKPRHQPADTAAEIEHDQRVEQEQAKRCEKNRPAQILRLALAVEFVAGAGQRRDVERRQPIGGRQRIDREQALRRPVKAGRMVGGGAAGKSVGTGRAVAGGAMKRPKPSRTRLAAIIARAVLLLSPPVSAMALVPASATTRLSMSTKVPDSGKSDQRVSPVTWKRMISPLPRRAAVTSGVPSASVAQVFSLNAASGSARTCRLTVTSVRYGEAVERAVVRKGRQRLRFVPTQAAAEDAAAAAQPHRHQIVVGRRQPRAGEAQQNAAVLDPMRQPVVGIAGDIADIGEDQHRHVLIEKMRHCFGRRFTLRHPDIGERIERAGDVIAGGEQRLRGVGGCAGNDADGAAAPALVEQLHGAR